MSDDVILIQGVHYLELQDSVNIEEKMVQFGRIAKVVVLTVAGVLVWRYYFTRDPSKGDVDVLQRVEEERKACLWRKGLESGRVLGDERTFSTFNCPVGQEAHPSDLCTAHLVYLNHTERAFVARTPAPTTDRYVCCSNRSILSVVTCTNKRYSSLCVLGLMAIACEHSTMQNSPLLFRCVCFVQSVSVCVYIQL